MKKRTFFTTLMLFLVFFNVAILLITTIMLKNNINLAKERCLAEHYVIASSLAKDVQALESKDIVLEETLRELMDSYAYFSQARKMNLSVFQEEQPIYSNTNVLPELIFDPSELVFENRFITVQDAETPILNIAGRLPEPFQEYILLYRYDMQEILTAWQKTKNLLYLFGSIFSILLALCLLLLLNRIFRPLGQISKISKSIAAGDFNNRLPETGHDELTDMSRSFNYMANQVQNQITELQEAAEQKQRFIDNFAHELRTPLTTIYGYAEYIQKAAITEEDKQSATGFILSECKRLQNMSYQLLNLAMLRGNEIVAEKINCQKFLQLIDHTIRPKTIEKGIIISYNNQLNHLIGNPELLHILLVNLLDNGIKACGEGGQISVWMYPKGKEKIISVRDNGKGMTPEQLLHVKEAFYRVDKARNRKDGGAGLGLALCEEIAQVHHAKIEITSILHQGTTVKVIFTS